jgi:hypothetical protein
MKSRLGSREQGKGILKRGTWDDVSGEAIERRGVVWRLLLISGRSASYTLFLGLRCVPRGFIRLGGGAWCWCETTR